MSQSNWRLARRVFIAGFACVLSGCGVAPTRFFSVFLEGLGSTYGAVMPDSCYRSATVPQAVSNEERAAEQFCQVPTKPTQYSGTTLTSIYTAESWSILDVSPDEAYLARTVLSPNGPSYRMGYGGKRSKNGYDFSGRSEQWVESCLPLSSGGGPPPGPPPTVCNGTCVSTFSDPANCGSCGRACAAGQACFQGNCTAACPTQQTNCGGVPVDLNSDRNNCGFCGRACEAGTVCRLNFGGGSCVPEGCGGTCSAAPQAGCGAPTRFARVTENNFNLELAGKDLRGVAWTLTSFSCANGGCAADLQDRCPSCSVGVKVLGSETTAAQEVQPR